MRWAIYARQRKWDVCRDIAETIVQYDPRRAWGWIHLAYATRRAEAAGLGLKKAQSILLSAIEQFPKLAIIPYNLACYSCMLGDLTEARRWLARAFEIGNAKELKLRALEDSDLEKLWRKTGAPENRPPILGTE